MNFQALTDKQTPELEALLEKTRGELRELKFRASEGQLKKVHQIKEKKQIIARILTLLSQRQKENA